MTIKTFSGVDEGSLQLQEALEEFAELAEKMQRIADEAAEKHEYLLGVIRATVSGLALPLGERLPFYVLGLDEDCQGDLFTLNDHNWDRLAKSARDAVRLVEMWRSQIAGGEG